MTEKDIDKHLDNVLRASGSALEHYSLQKTIDDMRIAMSQAMGAAVIEALDAVHAPKDADDDLDRDTKQSTPMPCPFCGHSDVVMTQGDTSRWRLVACNYCSARGPDVRVQTSGSGTPDEWERKAYDDAIAAWNQRAPSNMHLTAYVIGYRGGDCVIMPVDRKRLLNVGLPLYEFSQKIMESNNV